MKFGRLAGYLERLEKTPSRLEITRILKELFAEVKAEEIDKVVYLSLGILAPNYEGVILNIAEKMMARAIALAYGLNGQMVTKLYKKTGDLGNVAEALAKGKGSNLSVNDVYNKLLEVTKDNGAGSQERKIEKLSNLLKNLDPLSVRFVARIPVGRLRLGFSEKTILDALGVGDETYNIHPDIGYVARLAKEKNLGGVKPEIGVPVVPMLAQRLNSPSEMVKKMGEVSVEPKFDGLRAFIHYREKDNFVRVFTRNMNALAPDIFPELTEVGKYIKASEVILDTEAVGLDPKREMFLDFQKTMTRRRKHNIEKSSSDIPLQFQVFDLLLVDGRSLIFEPYIKRRKGIEKVIVGGDILRVDEHTITKDPEVIRNLHKKYLGMGLEGIIAKKANGAYISGRTGWNWVKMKEEEGKRGKLSDTVDCVIMGYSTGKGKRLGFGVGQFLVGIRDGDRFKTITKVGTGITDVVFKELNDRLKKLRTKEQPKEYEVHKDLTPDFWVIPEVVVEIAADEITVSPKHTAGLALRFPRLVRFRDDKSPKDTTTLKELTDLYKMQRV